MILKIKTSGDANEYKCFRKTVAKYATWKESEGVLVPFLAIILSYEGKLDIIPIYNKP